MENKIKLKINGLENCVGGTVHIVNKPACVDQNCLYTGNGIIEFNVDPELCGTDDICITGFIECDSCDSCGNQEFTVCLCTENTVLTNCQTCVNGILTETCSPEELAAGKICTPNGCNCTSDKPFVNSLTGKCSVCQENSINPANKCLVCKNGNWAERDCGTGSCNPTTGECIPDCNDSNASWNSTTNTCDCNPGYIKSATGCIPAPECTEDPIDQCKICVNGIIQDVVCPDPNKVCLNGDCVDPPCEGPCIDGYDCPGTNCGCGDENVCVDCATNPTALGCAPSGCSGSCSDGNDCPGDDCGCLDGKCVDCSYFGCNPDLCGQIDGCNCGGGTCSGDGSGDTCDDDLKLEVVDCSLEAELSISNRCQCEALSSGIYVDSITTDYGPPQPIGSGAVPTSDITRATFKVDIRKGLASTQAQHLALPLFSNSIINNESPEAGTAVLTITSNYRDDITGKAYSDVKEYIEETFANSSEVNFTNKLIGATERGYVLSSGQSGIQPIRTLLSYQIKVVVKDLEFESGCVYNTTVYNPKLNRNLTDSGFVNTFGVQSSSDRNPLFKWSVDGSEFRAFYAIADADGKFRDTLYGPQKFISDTERGIQTLVTDQGELISLKDYKLEVDCGCDKLSLVENVLICDIEFEKGVQFNFNDCSKTLMLDNQFNVCPVNRNLNEYNWGSNHPSQTKYILKVNGNIVETFIYNNNDDKLVGTINATDWNSWSKTFDVSVNTISLEMNHDSSCKVEHSIVDSLITPVFEATCEADGTVTYEVFDTSPSTVDYVKANGGTSYYMAGGTATISGLPKGSNDFEIFYKNGCVKLLENKTNNCCVEGPKIVITSRITDIVAGGKEAVWIDFTLFGFKGPVVMESFGQTPTGAISSLAVPVTGNRFRAKIGTTVLRVTDSDGCVKTAQITLGELVDTSTGTFTTNPQCIGSSSDLVINTLVNSEVEVSDPRGNILTGTTNSVGDITFTGLSVGGKYTLETVGVNSIGLETELVIVSTVQLNSMSLSNSNNYCTDGDVQVNISGTEYSEITLEAPGANGDLTVILDDNGNGSTVLTYPSAGDYTITAVSGSVGSCSTTLRSTLSVTIETVPNILGVTFDCIPPLVGDSDVVVNVSAETGLTVTGTVNGVESPFTATGAPNIYTATIIEGSGKDITIVATNGTGNCSDTETVLMPSCDCVIPPNPTYNTSDGDGVEYLCGVSVDLKVFNSSAGTTVKWYNDVSLLNLVGSGLTYTATSSGTYYVVAEHNTTGCQSNAILFSVIEGGYVLTMPTPATICTSAVNYPISAFISGDSTNMNYKFKVGGVVVQNGPSSTYLYTPGSVLGNKTIEVVTSRPGGNCVSTISEVILTEVCCTEMQINVTTDSEGCLNLQSTVTGGSGGYEYLWTGTGDLGTSISQETSFFDRTVLQFGEDVDLVFTVTDSNGCEQTENVPYTNCGCLCNELDACTSEVGGINAFGGFGTIVEDTLLKAGKTYEFAMADTGIADRFKIYLDDVLSVDTGYVALSSDGYSCATANNLPRVSLKAFTSLPADVTANIEAQDFDGTGSHNDLGVTLFKKSSASINGSAYSPALVFEYTPGVDQVLRVDHNDSVCSSQGNFAFSVKCI